MDWFKGRSTGKPHDLHGKIGLVSGENFQKKTIQSKMEWKRLRKWMKVDEKIG